MLMEGLDATNAAFKVGYESPSQFSREYGRISDTAVARYQELASNSCQLSLPISIASKLLQKASQY